LETEADSVDLSEVVGTGPKGSPHENVLAVDHISARKEDEDPRSGFAWVREAEPSV